MSHPIHVVGLLGRAGSGKGEAARYFIERRAAHRLAFGDPLKHMLTDVLGFTETQLWGAQADKERVDPRYGRTPRDFMVALGESARARMGEDVWCRAAVNYMHAQHRLHGHGFFVIDDVRKPIEARTVQGMGGVVIRINRQWCASTTDPNSPTERCVDEAPYDYAVSNDGTVEELWEALRACHGHGRP